MASTKSLEEQAPSSAPSSALAASSFAGFPAAPAGASMSFAGFPTAPAPASSSAPLFPGLEATPLVGAQPPLFGAPRAAPASSFFGGGYVTPPL